MMAKLYIVDHELDLKKDDLFKTIKPQDIQTSDTGYTADFSKLEKIAKNLVQKPPINKAIIDRQIGRALFEALKNVDNKTLRDPLFWQWMSLIKFRDLALIRTDGFDCPPQNLLSGKSLGNQSRHIFQRIFNILDLTYLDGNIGDKFKLGDKVLKNQDLIVQFLDSSFSLDKAFTNYHITQAADLGSVPTQQYAKKIRAKLEVYLSDYLVPSIPGGKTP